VAWRNGTLACAVAAGELLAILPHDRGGRPQPDSDAAALVDKGALGGNSPDDILGGQYRRHFAATSTGMFVSNAIFGVKRFSRRDAPISAPKFLLKAREEMNHPDRAIA
jgi:hypothetical protein